MIYFCIFFLAGILFVSIYAKRFQSPYRLYMLFGKKGSGKSTYLCKLALQYLKKGWNVYTNMEDFHIPGIRYFSPSDLGEFVPVSNSVILLDEAGTVFNSRDFKSFKPETRNFFKYQRHYKCIVYLASQSFDVDKTLRDLCDGLILQVNKFGFLTIGKRIYRSITLTEPSAESDSRIADCLEFAKPWNWTYTFIPRYAKHFDSYALPDHEELPYRTPEQNRYAEAAAPDLTQDKPAPDLTQDKPHTENIMALLNKKKKDR